MSHKCIAWVQAEMRPMRESLRRKEELERKEELRIIAIARKLLRAGLVANQKGKP